MRTINEYKKRFNQLMESTIGDVKPLISEENVNKYVLSQERLTSRMGEITKQQQEFLNKKYPGINLKTDGNWLDKNYNQAMEKFLKEKQLPIHYCKENDKFCGEESVGVITTTDFQKLKQIIASELNPSGSTTGNTTTSTGQTANKNYKINTTNDKSYDYMLFNNKYYFKGKQNTQAGSKYPKWVEATGKGLESIKNNVKFI